MEKLYEVFIENTEGFEDGLDSKLTKIICKKINGLYQSIDTNQIYGSSIVKVKEVQ